MTDKDSQLEIALTAAQTEARQWEEQALELMERVHELELITEEYEHQIKELMKRLRIRNNVSVIQISEKDYPLVPNSWDEDSR